MKLSNIKLFVVLSSALLVCSCGDKESGQSDFSGTASDELQLKAVIKTVNEMRFDHRLHVDSVPKGALVIYYPQNGTSADGKPRILGETPVVVDEPNLKPGQILIAFKTKELSEQLSQIPELRDVIAEFTSEMNDRRSLFAESSFAPKFYSSQFFKFPTDTTQELVGKGG